MIVNHLLEVGLMGEVNHLREKVADQAKAQNHLVIN
jgi:hypothetical protein